jgi:hypothetical protein
MKNNRKQNYIALALFAAAAFTTTIRSRLIGNAKDWHTV